MQCGRVGGRLLSKAGRQSEELQDESLEALFCFNNFDNSDIITTFVSKYPELKFFIIILVVLFSFVFAMSCTKDDGDMFETDVPQTPTTDPSINPNDKEKDTISATNNDTILPSLGNGVFIDINKWEGSADDFGGTAI